MSYDRQLEALIAQIADGPFTERLRAYRGAEACLDPEDLTAILAEAARYAAEVLAPTDRGFDAGGCRLEAGRVRLPPGFKAAYDAFIAGGWLGLALPATAGGSGLPKILMCAADEMFTRAGAAFMMFPNSGRSAARLLQEWGDAALQAEWLPRLVSGEWGATICISEPDAGSDVGRIRTRALPAEDGSGDWLVTGEKCWISYGDQDVTPRAAHFLLARTPDAPAGGRGLSLFLVPDRIDLADDALNGITIRRIEEKLGLHAAVTCVVGFEASRARLIGTIGRGLPQLFTMIQVMRLFVGAQGNGLATASAEAAIAYAEDRKQGGSPDAPPMTINRHTDVRRQLRVLASRVEVLRGLLLATAGALDLSECTPDPDERRDAAALLEWFLPILKNYGAETAFDVSSGAIQVFGGAGYTKEWPVERHLRDARVLAIFEGTTGMQALDLLHRRLWRDESAGLQVFLRLARQDLARAGDDPAAIAFARVLAALESSALVLDGWRRQPAEAEAGAVSFLTLAAYAATGWIALRLALLSVSSPVQQRLAASGRFWLSELPARAAAEAELISLGASRLEGVI